MQDNQYKISIAHLYPKLLNIYGDYGNITAIKNRLQWRNIDVEINNINIGDEINTEKYDIYFIGGGQDMQQIEVSKELQTHKEKLQQAANSGSVFLAICGGYQLLGHYYQPANAEKLEGISLLDAYTIAGDKRFIGNVTARSTFLTPNSLVGFENHSGLTYLEEGTEPLANISVGHGNNGNDKTEGARKNNVFGTYLHGSLLPKNPHFTDYLIKLALERKYKTEIELTAIDSDIEFKTHFSLIDKKY